MKHLINKLSAFLVMLMCVSAVAQAQTEGTTMVVTKTNGEETRFVAKNIAKVEWTNEDPRIGIGKAKANIGGNQVDVKWIQLWADGPKFAEYNVGATSATEYGGYYCWGKSIDKDSNRAYKEGTDALTGTDDTATNLWGSNWRMPSQAELEALLVNCNTEWTSNYKESDVKGRIFTGKGDYKGNSIFLPAAGAFFNNSVNDLGGNDYYWTSTPNLSRDAFCLDSDAGGYKKVNAYDRSYGHSVRAVLAE